jgi:uncharacterized protein (AIM24 family)
MCAKQSTTLAIHIRQRIGVGLFGSEGFIMQCITGSGMAFFEINGELVQIELAAGETVRVNPDYIAMHDMTVRSSIEMVKGAANIIFGGEGIFLTTLTGTGRVWLQTMPLNNLISQIIARMPKTG